MDGYVTRFHRRDGQPREDYYYRTKDEALNHLNLFRDDDSGLYGSIEVVDVKKDRKEASIYFG